MLYLIEATGGPGFASAEEAEEILEEAFVPGLDQLRKLMAENKVLAGGLPIGDRGVVFILDAASHDEADRILRSLTLWGALEWNVTPLQSIEGRLAADSQMLKAIKSRR